MSDEMIEEQPIGPSVPDGFEKMEGNQFWSPDEKGDAIQGVVLKKIEGTYGDHYVVDDAMSGEELMTPAHKVLQARMHNVAVGDTVLIIYRGEEPPSIRGNKPTKVYEVYKKK